MRPSPAATATHTSQGRPPDVVFMFAHQDDEFGVFHVIEDVVRRGRRPVCLYLTDGAHRGQTAERRNTESLANLRRLGVAPENVRFLGHELRIPDGELHLNLDAAHERALQVIRSCEHVDAMLLPAWEGGHQDHDAAHAIGVALAQELHLLPRTKQFSLYNGSGLPWAFFRVLSPLAGNGPMEICRIPLLKRLRYAAMCLAYPSQLRTWIGLFPFVLLDLLLAGVQRLQPVSAMRTLSRPHEGPLLYERRGFLAYPSLSERVAPFIARHAPPTCPGPGYSRTS